MIGFSQRLQSLPGYPLAEIPTLKRRLVEAGVDVIDLGAGDNDTPPPKVAVEAMTAALHNPALSKYGFQQGLPAFRQASSRWVERRFGLHFDPGTETLPLIGSKEGIAHFPLAFVDPGDVELDAGAGHPDRGDRLELVEPASDELLAKGAVADADLRPGIEHDADGFDAGLVEGVQHGARELDHGAVLPQRAHVGRVDAERDGDRHDPHAAHVAHEPVVLLGRNLARVPPASAPLALPRVAVGDVLHLAAVARDRDRRPAHRSDCTSRVVPRLNSSAAGATLAPPRLGGVLVLEQAVDRLLLGVEAWMRRVRLDAIDIDRRRILHSNKHDVVATPLTEDRRDTQSQ